MCTRSPDRKSALGCTHMRDLDSIGRKHVLIPVLSLAEKRSLLTSRQLIKHTPVYAILEQHLWLSVKYCCPHVRAHIDARGTVLASQPPVPRCLRCGRQNIIVFQNIRHPVPQAAMETRPPVTSVLRSRMPIVVHEPRATLCYSVRLRNRMAVHVFHTLNSGMDH